MLRQMLNSITDQTMHSQSQQIHATVFLCFFAVNLVNILITTLSKHVVTRMRKFIIFSQNSGQKHLESVKDLCFASSPSYHYSLKCRKVVKKFESMIIIINN